MRGYFLERSSDLGNVTYMCHNCGTSYNMWSFLGSHFPELQRQYRLDKFKPKSTQPEAELQFTAKLPSTTKTDAAEVTEETDFSWIPVDELEPSHPVCRYLKKRGVDDTDDFFFTDKFRELANQVAVEPPFSPASLFYDHSRIVTRIQRNGVLQGLVGRALSSKQEPRYLTIKAFEDAQMVFNIDNVNLEENAFITEGVYDCVILSNAVAQLGLSKRSDMLDIPHRVWCLDNQPRSPDVVKNMRDLIEAGESVVLWNHLPIHLQQYKDLNSMFVVGKASKEFLDEYVRTHIYSGTSALLELSAWAKVDARKKKDIKKESPLTRFKRNHRRFNDE